MNNGIISDYARNAFNYVVQRKGGDPSNANSIGVSPGYRSSGLLEMRAVSAAWVSLSAFAALSLIRKEAIFIRVAIVCAYGFVLLYLQSFTAIFCFFLALSLVELNAFALVSPKPKKKILKHSFIKISLFFSIGLALFMVLSAEVTNHVTNFFSQQLELATGKIFENSHGLNTSYFSDMINIIINFPNNMAQYPIGFLIGDGFASSFGVIHKGGDYGIVETLYKFGVFLFLLFIIGFYFLITKSLRFLAFSRKGEKHQLYFSVVSIIYIIFNDVHYSIWCTKSILPILFISLALQQRTFISKNN